MKYCELDFGTAILDKKVREKAIADRIEAIKYSHGAKKKFEQQFKDAKK